MNPEVIAQRALEFGWQIGWLLALLFLMAVALSIAQSPKTADRRRGFRLTIYVGVVILIAILAQTAMRQHDIHIDLTRAKTFTADPVVLEFVDDLKTPIRLTYFGHQDDAAARRVMTILDSLQRRSPLLTVQISDPDKDPSLARRHGVKFYNVAVIEAGEQRVLAKTTSEVDIVIAMQKALREKVTTLCFVIGHGEAEIHNEEFHTHVESIGGSTANHHHGHAHIPVVQSTSHGIGRLRRSLDALGYETKTITFTTDKKTVEACNVISVVQPKFAFAPSEIKKLEQFLLDGGALLVFLDLGYELGAWTQFLERRGVALAYNVVVDEAQHYENDNEALAISSYPQHVISEDIAMTIIPGARSIILAKEQTGLVPIVTASPTAKTVQLNHSHHDDNRIDDSTQKRIGEGDSPPVLMAATARQNEKTRFLIAGDADFLTNSYYPYLSNSGLALSIYRWASNERKGVNAEPAIPVFQTLTLSQMQMKALFIGLVFGVPGGVLLIGLLVWWRQK